MQARRELERQTSLVSDKSLGELLGELAGHSASLFRDELALARQELREKLMHLRVPVVLIALGAAGALIAALCLCTALVLGLTAYLEPWQSALLVGIVLSVAAGVLVALGFSQLKQADLKPEQTLETLEENKEWLKEIT
jgi:hypothetical protein